MNFMQAMLSVLDGQQVLLTQSGMKLSLTRHYPQLQEGDQVTSGIRPEHCKVCDDKNNTHTISDITVVEPTGISEQLYFKIEDKSFCVYSMQRSSYRSGDSVVIEFELDKLHLFDVKTEQRLVSAQAIEANQGV